MIEILPNIASTNTELLARLARRESIAENHWLVADRQTAGRGRLGREWYDGSPDFVGGNFMGSTLVRPGASDPPPATLALAAGLAVHAAVSPHLPPPNQAMLKWPNDVLVNGAKLAGILLERAGDAVVVGIGVNLTRAPELPDRATTALAQFAPGPTRNAFADALVAGFADELDRWRRYGLTALVARWQAAAHPPGTRLTLADPPLSGIYAGLSQDGGLRLTLADGMTRIVQSGEIALA